MNTDPMIDTGAPRSRARPQQAPLRVTSFGMTDPGREREANEDQFLIATLAGALRADQSSLPSAPVRWEEEQGHLFVVADGVGGVRGGKRASQLAVEAVEEHLLATLPAGVHGGLDDSHLAAELCEAVARADKVLIEESAKRRDLKGMGTTLTFAYTFGRRLLIAHVGDSRCYLRRGGALHQVTRDHTIVDDLVRRGLLEPEKAATHAMRHVITNVVGGSHAGLEPELHEAVLAPGDILMLCTDGLTEMLPDEAIDAILVGAPDPESACRGLVARANERGGVDNITVIVARYDAA